MDPGLFQTAKVSPEWIKERGLTTLSRCLVIRTPSMEYIVEPRLCMDVTGLSLSRYSRVVSASSELRSSRLDGIANHLSLTERLSNSDESVDVHPVDAVSEADEVEVTVITEAIRGATNPKEVQLILQMALVKAGCMVDYRNLPASRQTGIHSIVVNSINTLSFCCFSTFSPTFDKRLCASVRIVLASSSAA